MRAKAKRKWPKRIGILLVVKVVVCIGLVIGVRLTLRLSRHTTRSPMANLSHELQVAIQQATEGKTPGDLHSVIALSNQVTGRYLHFGLSHPTRLHFDIKPREGNCIEYSTLFASVFNQLARWAKLQGVASLVHSDEARIFGKRLPWRGWGDHDWVVIEGKGTPPQYVDPTFADYWLGWNLDGNVEGNVPKAW